MKEEYSVHPMAFIPRKTQPSTSSTALVIHIKVLTLNAGKQVASTTERPVVPPNTKWLGAQ